MSTHPTHIGAIVRKERKLLELRQDELAAASGVGLRFLVELERGKPTVQLDKVLAVLEALGCDLEVRTPEGVTMKVVAPQSGQGA